MPSLVPRERTTTGLEPTTSQHVCHVPLESTVPEQVEPCLMMTVMWVGTVLKGPLFLSRREASVWQGICVPREVPHKLLARLVTISLLLGKVLV